MYHSLLLIDTGNNPDRPGWNIARRWLGNLYRVHQRLCMGFPTAQRAGEDDPFLRPYLPHDFARGHVHRPRARQHGFLFRIDPLPPGRAAILVQSAIAPDWSYAFRNAQHLLAAAPNVRPWDPAFAEGQHMRFRLRANTVRRVAPKVPGKDGPRVPVPPTPEALRAWLDQRAARAGFVVDELACVVPGYVSWRKSAKDNGGARLRSVLYEGRLTVRDAGAFRTAVESGIGPAKAFGFGLLSVKPA